MQIMLWWFGELDKRKEHSTVNSQPHRQHGEGYQGYTINLEITGGISSRLQEEAVLSMGYSPCRD